MDRVEFLVGGALAGTDATAPYAISWDTTAAADGAKAVTARAVDTSGVSADSAARTLTVDNAAPDSAITGGPPEPTSDTSPAFSWAGSDSVAPAAELEYSHRLDVGAWSVYSGSAGATLAGVPQGPHVLYVRARDRAGNEDPTPAERAFTVDTTAPTVAGTTPAGGATGVSRSASVVAVFSEDMDPSALTASTVTLLRQGAATPLAAAVSYDAATRKVTLDPAADLESQATYTATVKGGAGGARDAAGNPLAADKAWSFTTGDFTSPTVASTTPAAGAAGVAASANVVATFSEAMDAPTLTTATFTLARQGTTTAVPAAVTYNATTKQATLDPGTNLASYATYTATVKGGTGGARDAAGNPLAEDRAWSFTTADTSAPSVSLTAPTDGALVRGTITLSASASDNAGVARVEFQVDGAVVGADATAPYSVSWSTAMPDDYDRNVTVSARATDTSSNPATSAPRGITIDNSAPTASAPRHALPAPSTLGTSAVPVRLAWDEGHDCCFGAGSGIARYELQQNVNTTTWTALASLGPAARAHTVQLAPGADTYRFRIRAVDNAGNVGAWAHGATFRVDALQETAASVAYTGAGWKTSSYSAFYGGSARYASASGNAARLAFTGGHVAWATTKGTNRGKAEVWLDGVRVATVDLYSASLQARQVVYSASVDPAVSHTLEVRALGTRNASSTAAHVDVDAFAVLR